MAAVTTAVVSAGAAAYTAKEQKDAAKDARKAQQQAGDMRAQGFRDAAEAAKPYVDKATWARAVAAQRAADLSAAGLGEARDIYRDIINGTYDVLNGLPPSQISSFGAYSGQNKALLDAFETAQADFNAIVEEGRAEFGDEYADALLKAGDDYATAIREGQRLIEQQGQMGDDDGFQGFQSGTEAFRMQLAMTGALGPEAQQEFYDQYQNSPKVQYQLQQIQRLAGSGAGGGNRLRALQELIAFNDDQYFDQLGTLAERSQRASESIGDARMSQAATELGLSGLETEIEAGLASTIGEIQADHFTTLAGLEQEAIRGEASSLSDALVEGQGAKLAGDMAALNTLSSGLSDLATAAGDIFGDEKKK